MSKRAVLTATALVTLIVAILGVLYLTNAPPVVPAVSDREAAAPAKPYVVKLHAQWCPVCRMTKGLWSQIEAEYSTRVNLVVFDFTNEATTAASRRDAQRLGLDAFYDENQGWTGTIAVLNGRTKETIATIHSSRTVGDYRSAIDAALQQTRR